MSENDHSNPVVKNLSRQARRQEVRKTLKQLQSAEAREVLTKEGFTALAQQTGLETLNRLMQEDVNTACGVRGKWEQNPAERTGSRNGYAFGAVWLNGYWMPIERPRAVFKGGGEVPLESYIAAQNPEFLTNAALITTVLGVSMRNHPKVVQAISPSASERPISGLSKSAIGRRFVAAADTFVAEFVSRRLDERYLAVWIDAVAEGQHSVLAAIGLTEGGNKKVLGLRQGSTENAEICTEFLEELKERGLSAERGILWVVDGGTAMLKALREVFGSDVLIQRCRVHKRRNVIEKLDLPEAEKQRIVQELEAVWAIQAPILAKAKLELLVRGLEANGHCAAARSLREGQQETLTCCRLGVPPGLMASLTNTNVIESTFSVHEATAHRVKRWRNGKQVLRWVALSSRRAETAFEQVGTPEQLAQLASALERHASGRQKKPPVLMILAS
jgi:transposase-like protein